MAPSSRSLRLRGDNGAATTELVIAAPVMLFILISLVQFGLWYHAIHVARAAADEAARTARTETGTEARGEDAGRAFLAANGRTLIEDQSVDVTDLGDSVRAEVHGHVVSVGFGYTLSVDAVVVSPKEQFVRG